MIIEPTGPASAGEALRACGDVDRVWHSRAGDLNIRLGDRARDHRTIRCCQRERADAAPQVALKCPAVVLMKGPRRPISRTERSHDVMIEERTPAGEQREMLDAKVGTVNWRAAHRWLAGRSRSDRSVSDTRRARARRNSGGVDLRHRGGRVRNPR